jgi:competence protein ComEC
MLSVPWPALGEGLLRLSALAVDGLWPILDWLAQCGWVYRGGVESSPVAVLAAGIGAFILLLPRGVPGRWVGALGLLPLLLPSPVRPPPGEVWLTVLDVGQGLAAVVETAGHVLVYDAGPRYSPGLDAGEAVVAPFLQWRGVARIDTLVLSHGDGDHIGGASSLVRAVPVGGILGAGIDSGPSAHPCRRGEEWAWDGVSFRVLHPSGARPSGDNASSCVLRVETSNGVLLIPGDVEARTEAELVAREGTSLRADVLVVPHHGSRGASSRMFVEAVAPRDALFATGYGNRFRFPAGEVLARYAALGARLHDTARGGAITVRLGGPRVAEVSHYRVDHRRFWHTPLADTPGGPHRANSGARTSAASSAPVGAGG